MSPGDTPLERLATYMAMDGPTCAWEVARDYVEPGASFSREAMDALVSDMGSWVGTRVMRRWQATNEPPTVMVVTLTVEVQ